LLINKTIDFNFENIEIFPLPKKKIREWINFIIENERKLPGNINFIFCDDETLLEYNRNYLRHDTLTDIITFDYSDIMNNVSGDIFISKERVDDNAHELNIPSNIELLRVICHGVLHLVGYKDKNGMQKEIMRGREDFYLEKFSVI
jgi:probable rRNA maturation factor